MQLVNIILGLAALAVAIPAPIAEPAPQPVSAVDLASNVLTVRAAQNVCGGGYTIETFGSNNCGFYGQGKSKSGDSCRVCVQMGDAQSWSITNPSKCKKMAVTYWHGANCNNGGEAGDYIYNTGSQACTVIPNVGNHFSAQFTCIA